MRITALLLAVGLGFLAAPAWAARINYAIVIGNNEVPPGHPELHTLRYADDDAARYYELFRRAGPQVALLTTFDAETRRRFPALAERSDPPTRASIERTIAGIRTRMVQDLKRGDRPVLFITYSGHGAEDETGQYTLTLIGNGISRDYLFDSLLSQVPEGATVHLIVDACRAAAVLEPRGAFDQEREGSVATLSAAERQLLPKSNLAAYPNVGVLIASSSSEETYEWNRIQSGVFTHVVVSGLLGAADVNGDRRVGYSEIAAFVSAATRSVPDSRVPRLQASPPMGGEQSVLVELDSLKDTVLLQGDPKGLGHLTVQLDSGLYWLEARLHTSHVTLALPSEGHALLRAAGGEAVLNTSFGHSLSLESLAFRPTAVAARGEVETPSEQGLFEFPYDLGYYLGFVDSRGFDRVGFYQGPTEMDKSRTYEGGALGPMVLGVASGLLLVTAGVTGYLAYDAELDHERTNIDRVAADAVDRYRTYGTWSVVTGVAGALAGGGALVWALYPHAEPQAEGAMRWGVSAAAAW